MIKRNSQESTILSKESERQNLKRMSIRWKWALGISMAIFLLYLAFAFLLRYKVEQVVLHNEQEEMFNMLAETRNRIQASGEAEIYNEQRITENGLILRVFDEDGAAIFESDHRLDFETNNIQAIDNIQVELIPGPDGKKVLSGVAVLEANEQNNQNYYIQIIDMLYSLYNIEQSINRLILCTGLLLLVFSTLIGLFIANNFLRPIRQLTRSMKALRDDPESEERIDVGGGNDELSHMANVYNSMVDRMQLNIENQKQFVEDVSHELRTPVAIVEGHLKLLKRWGKDDPEILEEAITASVQEIGRMKSLVQEMLDLSRATQADIHYQNEKTNIVEMLRQVHSNFKMLHQDFQFNLDIDADYETYINMHRNHLEQVLVILLDNAVKYSTDRLEIHVSISTVRKDVYIAIQDFGMGMSAEDSEKVFNRFYRIDKARSREKGGNGLGLSIAKQLVEAYGGQIWADSVLDYGTIFRIRLPILNEDQAKTELPD